jgi:hypothetical protein
MNDIKIIFGVLVMVFLGTTINVVQSTMTPTYAQTTFKIGSLARSETAPVATFENDVYVAWWTNKTGNDEVMYTMSSDAGNTFTDKINLSNTPNSDSVDVEISADEGKVAVTWWERNQTTNEPVIRVSSDGGKTFGPLLKLASDEKIGP